MRLKLLIRYLSGLNDEVAHVVELHPYTSLNELSVLAHKVESQKKAKGKGMASKPNPRPYPFQKPSYYPPKSTPILNARPPPQNPPQNNLPSPVTRKDVSVAKALDTLLPSVPTKELSLWPNIKLIVRS